MNFQPPDNPEMTPDDLQAEIYRLNKWADEFSNAQIKERQTGEMYQRELQATIEQQAAKIAELESSEREGWRYADELEHERKRLEAIIAEWDKRCEAGYNKLDWLDAVERVAELEAAIKNHRDVKGRFHTEQATLKLYALVNKT